MKKRLLLMTALMCTMAAWADNFNVGTDSELRAAIQNDGANITVTADIELSNSTLSIPANKTVTINLNTHALDRKLTKRGEGGGQVITVRKDATLILSNGTLQGGWGRDGGGLVNEGGNVTLTDVNITGNTADDRGGGISNHGTLTMTRGSITGNKTNDQTDPKGGGGIMNSKGASATLTNVTITGNTVGTYGGGGICNFGTLTLDGGTITGNTVGTHGGGIWQEGTLSMQGTIMLNNNLRSDGVADNLYLYSDKVITVTGALTGSTIGVTMQKSGTFTSGYNTHNTGIDPTTIFTADMTGLMAVSLDAGNEAQLANALPEGDIYYIERSWDEDEKCVKAEIKKLREGDYIVLTGSDDDLIISQGTFVVKGDVSYDNIYTVDGGKHNIILCDGAKLSADFLRVEDDNEVYIYGQANNTGQLVITEEALAHHAGIGSDIDHKAGTIVIHGGDINSKGSLASAGIGGGDSSAGGTVIIYGGKVYAQGESNPDAQDAEGGAGIGGGYAGNGSDLTVYGGYVEAKGSIHAGGAGIGSGRGTADENKPKVYGGNVTVYGGTVIAHGSVDGGAGIGGGSDGNGATVTIHGGTVKAWGRGNGAGIGTGHNSGYNWVYIDFMGKLTVTGGEVYAYGHDDEVIGGAGIGGGRDANGSEVIITGGYVYAEGGRYSAGIGSGCEALFSGGVQGGSLTVTGGRVEAYGGEDAAGIGGGEDADGGTIKISGGYVYAKGSYGGAGIGGGEGGDGANVTITGGTVHASAGSGETGNRAIGPGYGDDVYGKLTVGDEMMVYSERKAAAVERHDMCWYRTDVHVEQCTHPDHTYSVSGTGLNDTHTEQCTYCTTAFVPEKHTFENGVCTVCGVEETTETHTVSYYLPGNTVNTEYGEPTNYQYIKGETITLPTASDDNAPANLTFAGWHVGTPAEHESIIKQPGESLEPAGTEYTVDTDFSFAARYDYIHLTLNNASHNGEALARYNGKQAQDVTLQDRTLYRDGRWNTLCLPFDVASFTGTPLEGATVKTLSSTSLENGTLTLNFTDDVTTLEAGKPYIIKWPAEAHLDDIDNPTFNGVTISNNLAPVATTAAEGTKITFAGAYSPMFIVMERKNLLYLGADNKLYYPSGMMTIGSCRGHFRLQGIEAGDPAVSAIELNFDGGETTSISEKGKVKSEKLATATEWYDLQGRKLSGKPTTKGIYINNGSKIVIK